MKPITLALSLALCASTVANADDGPMQTTTSNSEFNYYGADQPFAHPSPPSLNTVPPRTYIPIAPRTFIPIASEHVFSDSRLPTVADAAVRVFVRFYDAERGIYVNQEVVDPDCLLACLNRQAPRL